MKPVVTLFHWDLPLLLEIQYGGFSSEQIIEDFARYAGIIFTALGKQGVKTFFTINEP
jgi:beta-glucosidase/6-phospho-beta-glucosidase/beta-galactosidase